MDTLDSVAQFTGRGMKTRKSFCPIICVCVFVRLWQLAREEDAMLYGKERWDVLLVRSFALCCKPDRFFRVQPRAKEKVKERTIIKIRICTHTHTHTHTTQSFTLAGRCCRLPLPSRTLFGDG